MVLKGFLSPEDAYEELMSPENPEMESIEAAFKEMPLQDPQSSTIRVVPTANKFSPQPCQSARAMRIQSLILDSIKNNPTSQAQIPTDPVRPNTPMPTTVEGVVKQGQDMISSLDTALGHIYQLYAKARDVLALAKHKASSSSENTGKNNVESKLDELILSVQAIKKDVKEIKSTLADHGTTMLVVEGTVHNLHTELTSITESIEVVEKMSLEVGTAVQHMHVTANPKPSSPQYAPTYVYIPKYDAPRFP